MLAKKSCPNISPLGKVERSLKVFEQLAYNYPEHVWEIGFSGGKDSTVVCHLALEYVDRAESEGYPLPKKLFILYSDTLLDVPILRKHTYLLLDNIVKYVERFDGLVEVKVLKPFEDFFSKMIEDGYPAPHRKFRWCMDRLKIKPTVTFLAGFKKYAMISGVRKDESLSRRKNIMKRRQSKEILEVDDRRVFVSPILSWTKDDVWAFLRSCKQPWNGQGYSDLFKIYEMADGLAGCGRCMYSPTSRFGCWVCTVVQKDRMLESLTKHSQEYVILLYLKEKIREISLRRECREIDSNGKFRKLNQIGRDEVVKVLAETIILCDEAVEGYLEDGWFQSRLLSWLQDCYHRTGDKKVVEALEKVKSAAVKQPLRPPEKVYSYEII